MPSLRAPMSPPVAQVRVERPAPEVSRLVLARPEVRNAQSRQLLYELNDAFDDAARDDEVKVVILAGDGPDFSSGHDLHDTSPMDRFPPVGCGGGMDRPGAEGWMALESEIYLELCWRWRNHPKPTIAALQGRTIAGGLMLAWVCDLIVAADDATFSDPVVAFGLNGHELFLHAWELGARRAKEILFTGGAMTATEAAACGMVNEVVPAGEVATAALELAQRVARMPSMGLSLAKQAVNQSLEAQGQWNAVKAAFALHQVGHAHSREVHGAPIDPAGPALVRHLVQEADHRVAHGTGGAPRG